MASAAELVILCGMMGAGKTTTAAPLVAAGSVVVSNDLGHSKAKQLKMAREALEAGKGVVVDNTNASIAHRAPWIALAHSYGAPAHIAWCSRDGRAANARRVGSTRVPPAAYAMWERTFQPPTAEEGVPVRIVN